MSTKQSKAALIRLIETGIRDVGDIPEDRLYVLVSDIDVSGSPPKEITAYVSVRFLPSGEPFCCGQPGCCSEVLRDSRSQELEEYLRRKMNLRHTVNVKLRCTVEYYDGIQFTAFAERSARHGHRDG